MALFAGAGSLPLLLVIAAICAVLAVTLLIVWMPACVKKLAF